MPRVKWCWPPSSARCRMVENCIREGSFKRDSRAILDFLEKLAAHRLGEILIGRHRHDETAGPGLHILLIPLREIGLFVEDGEPVDDDASCGCHVAGLADQN